MKTLRKIHGPYLFVLIAMGGLVASSLGVLTNTAGIFFSPIAQELGGRKGGYDCCLCGNHTGKR